LATFGALAAVVLTLTVLGALDRPASTGEAWTPRQIAGVTLIESTDRCARCHTPEGIASPVEAGTITRPPDWLASHVADPIVIAPGLRQAPFTSQADTSAIVDALGRMRSAAPPAIDPAVADVIVTVNRECLVCHTIDGGGGSDGPDLSAVGLRLDAAAIALQIADPYAVKPDSGMPPFGGMMTPERIREIAEWLAARGGTGLTPSRQRP
jgi:mono/diheme cytochrome c family protein